MELLGEFVEWDGRRQQLRVSFEVPNEGDPFEGLLSALQQMRESVNELLNPLMQRGAPDAAAAAAAEEAVDDEFGDDEDGIEDENNVDNGTNSDGPSAKRLKSPFLQ
ncbi:EKC/KEOPS complex subunit GON7 [Tenrec ecaudatus]|uniref:EKC/KEOPS complex subunit GON7 n=1 Tax=Tenrec ecaudatus TaxID=94439 RepID=UPI003F59A878